MTFLLGIIGIIGSFFLIKYRQQVGDTIGDPDWASRVGGIYNVLILVAIFIFFWSIAEITGTTGVLFGPVINLFNFGKSSNGAGPLGNF